MNAFTTCSWHVLSAVGGFLYNWQTLVAGSLAVGIGFMTIRQVRNQIELQKEQFDAQQEQHDEQDRRKRRAVLALLPADLSEFCGYAQSCSDVTCQALSAQRRGVAAPDLEMPVLPTRVLSNMQRTIENVDFKEMSVLAELLRCYQVQNSRTKSLIANLSSPGQNGRPTPVAPLSIEQNFELTVLLHLLASDLLDFARGKQNDVNVENFSEEQILNTMHNLGITNVLSEKIRTLLLNILQKRDLPDGH